MPKRAAQPGDAFVDDERFVGRGWADSVVLGLKPSSQAAYRANWRAYLVYLARRGRDAASVTASDVEAYLSEYADTSAVRRARFFEEVYTYAIRAGRLNHNPFSEVELLKKNEPRAPPAAVTLPKVSELLEALPPPADWKEHRDQAAVVLAVSAGLRLRELRELEMVQVQDRAEGFHVSVRGRTAHSRDVALEPDAAQFMRGWVARRRGLAVTGTRVFPAPDGKSVPTNTLYRRIRTVMEGLYGNTDLPHFGVSVLRATFASRFKKSNSLVNTQFALGHRRFLSTLRFINSIKPVDSGKT